MGFLGGKHRVFIRQVHTAHATAGQLRPYGLGFLAVAHKDGDV